MSPKIRKKLNRNLSVKNESEKKKSNFKQVIKKSVKGPGKTQPEKHQPDLSMDPDMKVKPLGFWSKKLQDLEESEERKKKSSLYEFCGTDESDSSYPTRKKIKQRPGAQRKRQPSAFNYKKSLKVKKTLTKPEAEVMKNLNQVLDEKENMLQQKRKDQIDKGEKCMFSTGSKFTLTSTPATNEKNFITALNFQFLSPIINEQRERHTTKSSSAKLKVGKEGSHVVHLNQETPKLEAKLKKISCRRVLRNGKMLER